MDVAPAFEKWVKQQTKLDSKRSAAWKKEMDDAREITDPKGVLLVHEPEGDCYVFYFAESAKEQPRTRGDLHFTSFALRINPRDCVFRLDPKFRSYPPAIHKRKTFASLLDAAQYLIELVEAEMPDSFPKISER